MGKIVYILEYVDEDDSIYEIEGVYDSEEKATNERSKRIRGYPHLEIYYFISEHFVK